MIRLAVRALIVEAGRLLVVNAYPGEESDLWCAPGGGAEPHVSLPENLVREVREETGLEIAVGVPVLVNEFHEPDRGFHQVDVYFRCRVVSGALDRRWRDPAGIVSRRRFVSQGELARLQHKPDSLAAAAWGGANAPLYDPLERLVR